MCKKCNKVVNILQEKFEDGYCSVCIDIVQAEKKKQAAEDAKVENRILKIVSSKKHKTTLSQLPEKYQAEVLAFVDKLNKRGSSQKHLVDSKIDKVWNKFLQELKQTVKIYTDTNMIKNNFNHMEFISLEGKDKDKILLDMRYIAYNLGANALVNISISHAVSTSIGSITPDTLSNISIVRGETKYSYVIYADAVNIEYA